MLAKFMGPKWVPLGSTGPRWAPCWTPELCGLCSFRIGDISCKALNISLQKWILTVINRTSILVKVYSYLKQMIEKMSSNIYICTIHLLNVSTGSSRKSWVLIKYLVLCHAIAWTSYYTVFGRGHVINMGPFNLLCNTFMHICRYYELNV